MALSPCATYISYEPTSCTIPAGGISNLFIFDNTLFDFTQASPISNTVQPYTAITDLGTSTKIYPIKFEPQSAEYDYDQKNDDGVAPAYTHKVMFSVPSANMKATQWAMLVNQFAYCCGLGIIIITNSQDILIMGEGSVNAAALIPKFFCYQDGSKGATGKKGSDKNTVTVTLKSVEYFRPLIQYTGTVASILALAAP
jgi:hypothetical protein